MFARLRDGLVPLIEAVSARDPMDAITDAVPLDAQWKLSSAVAAALGFDFDGGRLDRAEHPFSSAQGEGDVRITAHLKEHDVLGGLGGTIHETGHALYEQGLPFDLAGTTVREAASFGLHESQSRFWENYIGRSRPFADFLARTAQASLGAQCPVSLADPERVFRAQNRVARSLIRTQADEVTYNLHIMLRFDLERAVLQGDLPVADLPAAWDERFERDFGLRPPTATAGVLQDIHWSAGLVGYFPTYTLGNLYAAQLMAAAGRRLGDLDGQFAAGEFAPLLGWLRSEIHAAGRMLESDPLVERATGLPVSADWLAASLQHRYGPAHGL
jgi:carboxypeptidase Taq